MLLPGSLKLSYACLLSGSWKGLQKGLGKRGVERGGALLLLVGWRSWNTDVPSPWGILVSGEKVGSAWRQGGHPRGQGERGRDRSGPGGGVGGRPCLEGCWAPRALPAGLYRITVEFTTYVSARESNSVCSNPHPLQGCIQSEERKDGGAGAGQQSSRRLAAL